MSEQKDNSNENKLSGHNYDGIEEYDNNLPRWWLYLFYLTIVFSIGYAGYYWFGSGPTLTEEYEAAKSELADKTTKVAAALLSEDELQKLLKDPERVKAGAAIFSSRCTSCHGDKGQGGIGPNLTDEYWLHGGKMSEILNTVTKGVAEKGMPPWGAMLKQEELYSVVTFVKSLKGSNPAGAKAPQGDLVHE